MKNENRLSPDIINKTLEKMKLGNKLYFFEEVTSTFDAAQNTDVSPGTVVCARVQTGGRGRLGRKWCSSEGGIYFSLILKPAKDAGEIQVITAMCALAVQRTLSKYISCFIKWPNDIVSQNGKKLCGILSKAKISGDEVMYINAGIGINANISDFDSSLPHASSLKLLTGSEVNENEILCEVLREIDICIKMTPSEVMKSFEKVCITIGSQIKLEYHCGGKSIEGKCTGIEPDGSLIIQTDDAEALRVNSGEVSVRGIYDYV